MKIAIAGASGLIGRKLTDLAHGQGHEVVALSRRSGYDLTDAAVVPKLTEALEGVDAVVDVTQGASFEEADAVEFFRSVATHLGQAARAAGVPRTVVLSIVGIERGSDYGYYVGKVAQEKTHREYSPGVVVLRATQFHEFAGQMLEWSTTDGVAEIMDVEIQPVDSAEVVRTLLDLAAGPTAHDVQLAGPRVERLLDLAREETRRRELEVEVRAGDAPASMQGGGMLPQPGDGVVDRGPTWQEWADAR